MELLIKDIIIFIILLIASVSDIRTKKVPNILFIIGIITWLCLDIFLFPAGFKTIIVKIVVLLAWFLFGIFRLMGFGDLKMMMVISAIRGIFPSLMTLLFGCIIFLSWRIIRDKDSRDYLLHFIKKNNEQQYKSIKYAFMPFITIGFLMIMVCTYISGGYYG